MGLPPEWKGHRAVHQSTIPDAECSTLPKLLLSLECTQHLADWTMQWFNCTLKVCAHMLTHVYRVWHVRNAVSTTQGHVHCNRSCPCSNRLDIPLPLLVYPSVVCTRCIILPHIHIYSYKLLHAHQRTTVEALLNVHSFYCTSITVTAYNAMKSMCGAIWPEDVCVARHVGELIVSNCVELSINNWLQDTT